MARDDLRIALGPVGAAGLLALVLALLRRSPWLAVLGGAAVAADVALPQLRGFAALRLGPPATPDATKTSQFGDAPVTPSAA